MPIVKKVNEGKYDEELVPLIEALNKVGIKTIASCSGHGRECAYVAIDMSSVKMVRIHNNALVIDWELQSAQSA
jgi:hypothetical protein